MDHAVLPFADRQTKHLQGPPVGSDDHADRSVVRRRDLRQISRRRKRSDAPPTPRRDSARQMARTAA
jgi:hypothetical protein